VKLQLLLQLRDPRAELELRACVSSPDLILFEVQPPHTAAQRLSLLAQLPVLCFQLLDARQGYLGLCHIIVVKTL
jgi:hypothetical protein